MASINPLADTFGRGSKMAVSKRNFFVAGIMVDVLGLDEIPAGVEDVSVLWLLNPRLCSKETMLPTGEHIIRAWNKRLVPTAADNEKRVGLIAAAFDQRNHGTRLLSARANEAWRGGNPTHAQDMYSIFQGTAADTSVLVNYLEGYVFASKEKRIVDNLVLGVSLGGHAAWHCILHEPRISAAIVVIGCADYVRVMTDRAKKSKLMTWTSTKPQGSSFLGSKDFPLSLIETIDRTDPAGLLMGQAFARGWSSEEAERDLSAAELDRLRPLMARHLHNKKILNLAGGADKLVPYWTSEPFLRFLKKAISPQGWFADGGLQLEDHVFEGVGHEMNKDMIDTATRWLLQHCMSPVIDSSKAAGPKM